MDCPTPAKRRKIDSDDIEAAAYNTENRDLTSSWPYDIAKLIGFLLPINDTLNCERVCKRWHSWFSTKTFWNAKCEYDEKLEFLNHEEREQHECSYSCCNDYMLANEAYDKDLDYYTDDDGDVVEDIDDCNDESEVESCDEEALVPQQEGDTQKLVVHWKLKLIKDTFGRASRWTRCARPNCPFVNRYNTRRYARRKIIDIMRVKSLGLTNDEEYYWTRYDNREEYLASLQYMLDGSPEAPVDEILECLEIPALWPEQADAFGHGIPPPHLFSRYPSYNKFAKKFNYEQAKLDIDTARNILRTFKEKYEIGHERLLKSKIINENSPIDFILLAANDEDDEQCRTGYEDKVIAQNDEQAMLLEAVRHLQKAADSYPFQSLYQAISEVYYKLVETIDLDDHIMCTGAKNYIKQVGPSNDARYCMLSFRNLQKAYEITSVQHVHKNFFVLPLEKAGQLKFEDRMHNSIHRLLRQGGVKYMFPDTCAYIQFVLREWIISVVQAAIPHSENPILLSKPSIHTALITGGRLGDGTLREPTMVYGAYITQSVRRVRGLVDEHDSRYEYFDLEQREPECIEEFDEDYTDEDDEGDEDDEDAEEDWDGEVDVWDDDYIIPLDDKEEDGEDYNTNDKYNSGLNIAELPNSGRGPVQKKDISKYLKNVAITDDPPQKTASILAKRAFHQAIVKEMEEENLEYAQYVADDLNLVDRTPFLCYRTKAFINGSVPTYTKEDSLDEGPNPPKSAYKYFACDNRKSMKETYSGADYDEISESLVAAWKQAPPSEKAKYEALQEEDFRRYEKLLESRRAGGDIAKPASAYMLFAMDNYPQLRKDNPYVALFELDRLLKREWDKCPADDKAKYTTLAAKDRQSYEEVTKTTSGKTEYDGEFKDERDYNEQADDLEFFSDGDDERSSGSESEAEEVDRRDLDNEECEELFENPYSEEAERSKHWLKEIRHYQSDFANHFRFQDFSSFVHQTLSGASHKCCSEDLCCVHGQSTGAEQVKLSSVKIKQEAVALLQNAAEAFLVKLITEFNLVAVVARNRHCPLKKDVKCALALLGQK